MFKALYYSKRLPRTHHQSTTTYSGIEVKRHEGLQQNALTITTTFSSFHKEN